MQDVVDSISDSGEHSHPAFKTQIYIVYEWNAMANIRFFIIIVIMTDMFT